MPHPSTDSPAPSRWARGVASLRALGAKLRGRDSSNVVAEPESVFKAAPDLEAVFRQRSLEAPGRPWTFRDDWKRGRFASDDGKTTVVLEVVAQIGTRLAGRIEMPSDTVPVRVVLECVARRNEPVEDETDRDVILWSTSMSGTLEMGQGGQPVVPFSIPIPGDAMSPLGLSPHPTSALSPAETAAATRRVLWRLVLEAEPGYRAVIEVPVFASASDLDGLSRGAAA